MSDSAGKDSLGGNAADSPITLSAALLAPLNSLFETQVHSARAFLSFLLQMGFKDKVTAEELDAEEARLKAISNPNAEEQQQLQTLQKHRELINARLEHKDLKSKGDLTDDEAKRLAELGAQLGDDEDVFTLKFQYKDGQGRTNSIVIPALALIPVQPLAIKSATFDFQMSVESSNERFESKQKGRAVRDSPWAFIQPKRIKGKIASHNQDSTNSKSGISIHVEVASTPIPEGLSSLLTSLTQSARIENE